MPDSLANLFDEALKQPAAERAAFIDQACGDDAALRKRLHAMIAAHENPDSFLEPNAAPISGIPETTAQPTSYAGTRVGNYKLLQKIGEGGFGVVFMAEQESPPTSHRLGTCGDQLTAVAKHRSVSPDRLHRELRGDLDWIVMKGLEKDRQRRYESAEGMAQDVRRFLADEPVDAGPPTTAYRLRKWLRRNRRTATTAAVVTVLLLAAGGWYASSWLQRISRQASATHALSNALENASLLLGRAVNSPIGESSDWVAARASRQRIVDLLHTTEPEDEAQTRARNFLAQLDKADADRQLAGRIEEVVITGATHEDAESWARMEQELREVFKSRGIDFAKPQDLELTLFYAGEGTLWTDLSNVGVRANVSLDKTTNAAQMQTGNGDVTRW